MKSVGVQRPSGVPWVYGIDASLGEVTRIAGGESRACKESLNFSEQFAPAAPIWQSGNAVPEFRGSQAHQ